MGAEPGKTWSGKWALVTGASAGIGRALAEELARSGTNLVLTARRRERLEELAGNLTAQNKVQAKVFVADLAAPDGPEKIFQFTNAQGIEVELLINNAGFGVYGEFADREARRTIEMVQVNCAAVVHLTRLYLPGMIARGHGDVMILASTAAFQAVPYISTYAATKAFDLLFAEGLAEEMKPRGVRVCALCPGSTESEFAEVAGQAHLTFSKERRETAQKVARTGLQALAAGKSYVISGVGNYFGVQGQRLVSRRFVTRVAAKMFRPAKKSR